MAILKDSLLVIARIYTIYPLLLAVTLYMGRRSVGQLPVFDFLIILSLGSVVGADIADPKIQHIHTAVAILAIGLMQRLFSRLVIRYRKFGKLVSFEPAIVLKDGIFLHRSLKKLLYTTDDILQLLRAQGFFDPAVVELAVLEGDGQLSVLKKARKQQVTPESLGLPESSVDIAYAVVKEGIILQKTLAELTLSETWLHQQLESKGLLAEDIFFASLNAKRELTITPYEPEPKTPPLYH
ncbi:DUF421 domain-containing protein [Paenibacillus sp. MY03]|uniref:DUF421 domain-containing protein n=1 Tax=Paenibacillus sp. MY03 TaxID=302980 RepID=UPI000B3BEBD3|nr:DUF421 domain-containing protein [Paenibacillus sp. MY03]OUS74972.1 DUF421 domain-containing protein [Paenibacillus sp. MY03]